MTHPRNFRFFLFLVVLVSCSTCNGQATEAPDQARKQVFWARKIAPTGKMVIEKYGPSVTTELDLSDLEIWSKLEKDDPLTYFYFDTEPDWKWLLLSKGYARLKDEGKASSQYVAAQNKAKEAHLGLWADDNTDGILTTLKIVGSIVFGLISLWGGASLYRALRDWRKWHQVPLILLGRPSTGKSWLWHRLVDPDVSVAELEQIPRGVVAKRKTMRTKPLGRYEITPIPIDTPGGQSGEQVNVLMEERSLLRRLVRLLVRAKSVWLFTLSTTPERHIDRNSTDEAKVDEYYIEQQLGHLDLPVGMLSSKRTPKPQMVIVCIAKFDVFAEHEPRSPFSKEVSEKLSGLFMRHTSLVETECKNQNIPFKIIMCSAREGWGMNEIWRQVENAIFQ